MVAKGRCQNIPKGTGNPLFFWGGGQIWKETEDDILSKNEGGQDTFTMNGRLQEKVILVWTQMKHFYGFNHPIQFVFTFSYLREGEKTS